MITKFKFFLLTICYVFLLASCSSDDDTTVEDLSGTYIATSFESSGCNDSEENFSYSGNTTDGMCFMEDGISVCLIVEFTFGDGMYTTTVTSQGGGFSFTATDSGTYDPDSGADELCVDGDCGQIDIQNNGNRIVFTGSDEDGCNLNMVLDKV